MNNVESTCEKQGFEILHSVANRVRLRALDTKTKDKLTAIAQHLRSKAGIQTVRINQDTGNLVITYDQNIVSGSQVQQLLEPFGITQEITAPELLGSDSYNQTLKRLSSFIPPVVAIAAVRGLGIYGWQALAAYIVTTNVTRGVMNQLDLPLPRLPENKQVKEKGNQTVGNKFPTPVSIAGIKTVQSRELNESHYRIIHQIPGRIRLSIKRVKQDLDYVKQLENLTQWDNRITSVRVNPESGSVVINYRTGTPSNTGKMPLNTAELSALLELIASEKADPKNETSLKEIVDSQRLIPQEAEVDNKGYVNKQEGPSELDNENLSEKKEINSNNLLEYEPISEEDDSNHQPPSGLENHFDDEEQPLSSTNDQPEESSSESIINPIVSTEPDYKRFELSEEESESPWRRFKACMLTTMLRLMVNFPLQQA